MSNFTSSDNFSISGFDDEEFKVGKLEYVLQINPSAFNIKIGDEKESTGKLANGDFISVAKGKEPDIWNFTFLVDNTGVLPRLPSGCSETGESIATSLEFLKEVTKKPRKTTHIDPFVEAVWSDQHIRGNITKSTAEYTYFDNNGNPLRAIIEIEITGIYFEGDALFQSPDISRMPTIKEGENLVQYCEEYYKDKNFYLKIAELNNLSSFRALKKGKRLEFPPIKK